MDELQTGTLLHPLGAAATFAVTHPPTEVGAADEHGHPVGTGSVDAALRAAGSPARPSVAVVGTGRLARSALDRLRALGHAAAVFGRDFDRSAGLVGPERAFELSELRAHLHRFDVMIFATSSPAPLLHADDLHPHAAGRIRRALVVVDLGVPRNVHPGVGRLTGVHLLDSAYVTDPRGAEVTRELRLPQLFAVA